MGCIDKNAFMMQWTELRCIWDASINGCGENRRFTVKEAQPIRLSSQPWSNFHAINSKVMNFSTLWVR